MPLMPTTATSTVRASGGLSAAAVTDETGRGALDRAGLDAVAVAQLGTQRHQFVVHLGCDAAVADVGVDQVGEVHRGRAARDAPRSAFVLADGRNVAVTFILVSSLFLLWGFCNGMIDVMDKHFQSELHLTLAQSAWVQFAHYLGYFLMALPAGWLMRRLGYRRGILVGLALCALGTLLFQPAATFFG